MAACPDYDLNAWTECSVCLNTYTCPRALPCLHTFCHVCLQSHIEASMQRHLAEQTFHCPICRNVMRVPETGAEHFPLNILMNEIIEFLKRKEKIKSTFKCDICKVKSPETYCAECDKSMCAECLKYHKKFPKDHVIYKISDIEGLEANQIFQRSSDYCKDHVKEKVKFFCTTCNEIICADCSQLTHRGDDHKYVEMSKKNEEWKAEVGSCAGNIETIRNNLLDQIETTDNSIKMEESEFKKSKRTLKKQVIKLKNEIDEWKEKIVENLSANLANTRIALQERKTIMKTKLESLDDLSQSCQHVMKYSRNSVLYENTEEIKRATTDIKSKMTTGDPSFTSATFHTFMASKSPVKALLGGVLKSRPIQSGAHDVTVMTTGDIVVGSRLGEMVIYSSDGTGKRTLPRPPEVDEWAPIFVTSSADRILVSNSLSDRGIVEFTASGQLSGHMLKGVYVRSLVVWREKLIVVNGFTTVNVYAYIPGGPLNRINIKRFEELGFIFYATVNKATEDIVLTHRHGVTALNQDLSVRWTYACTNSGPGVLSHPRGVATTASGHVLVADVDSGRVVRLTQHGEFVRRYQLPRCGGWDLDGLDVSDTGALVVVNTKTSHLFQFDI